MTPVEVGHWERAQSIFAEAADLPEDRKRSFVEEQCGGDDRLAASVFELLEEDKRQNALLDGDPSLPLGWMADLVLQQDSISALIEQQIGPYRLLRLLGEGGMGVVYLAERTDIGGLVAIKLLRDAWMSPMRRERFRQEQQTLVKLNHPAIARLYDAGATDEGTPWFVMEYAEGEPLTQYLTARSAGVRDDLLLFLKVCEAVRYAHSVAIIHRDLKPSNIVVTKDGEVKLLDFGIAKEMAPETGDQQRTIAGLRLLTPGYAAPEQYSGEEIGVFTDVYSLGVLLYEVLTGGIPDPAETREGRPPERPSVVVRKGGGRRSWTELSRQEWSDLDAVCMTAMRPDPAERYPSVESLLRDVRHYLDQEPLDAQPDRLRYRAGKFALRHRRGIAVSAAGAAVLVALIAGFTWRLAKERNAAQTEAARVRRIQDFMTGLLQGGDQEAGPAADLKVSAMIDRGVQQAGSLGNDIRVQADLYQTLGTMAQKLGRPDQAGVLLEKALDEHRSLDPPDVASTARSQIALGLLRAQTGKAKEGEQMVRQALAEVKGLRPANRALLGEAELALGSAMVLAGEQKDSIPVLREAAEALRSLPGGTPSPQLGRALATLGDAETYSGNYAEAESFDRQALAADRAAYGDGHPRIAEDLGDIAQVFEVRGYYTEAEPLERQALAIMQRWYGPEHPETARKMITLGSTLLMEKDKQAETDDLLARALAILKRVYGDQHPSVAYALNSTGTAALFEKRYEEAERDYLSVASIYRQAYGDADYRVAVALGNLSSVYMAEKRYSECERVLRDVVERFARALGETNIQTAMSQVRLGRTLLYETRYAEAERYSRMGYETLSKQTSPNTSYVAGARHDLALDYAALKQPEKARTFADPPNPAPH